MNAFEFTARMWRGAEAMTALQEDMLGEVISLDGQNLADLVAFAHDAVEQAKLTRGRAVRREHLAAGGVVPMIVAVDYVANLFIEPGGDLRQGVLEITGHSHTNFLGECSAGRQEAYQSQNHDAEDPRESHFRKYRDGCGSCAVIVRSSGGRRG